MVMKIGDLCWAKMRGYPLWPGKILDAPESEKNRFLGKKRLYHYIYFFGPGNHAWVDFKNIKPNSEEMIKQASQTRFIPLRKAIQQLERDMTVENYFRQGIVKKCHVRVERLNSVTAHIKVSNSQGPNESLSLESCPNEISEPQKKLQVRMDDEHCKPTKFQENLPSKFGFIGHGEIGKEILKNLLNAKCDVTIWSQTAIEYDLSVVKQTADSFLVLIASCDIIFCYADTEDNAGSFLKGDNGILQSFNSIKPCDGKGFVLLANIDLKDSADTAANIKSCGARYIEAPLIGSKMHAINGELLILCSGDQSLFLDCKTAFKSFPRVRYLGPDIGYALKFHSIMGLFLKSISKSYKEIISLIKSLELPLPVFRGLLNIVFNESYLATLCLDPLEKEFFDGDRMRFFLKELDHETLLAMNFSTEDSFNKQKKNIK